MVDGIFTVYNQSQTILNWPIIYLCFSLFFFYKKIVKMAIYWLVSYITRHQASIDKAIQRQKTANIWTWLCLAYQALGVSSCSPQTKFAGTAMSIIFGYGRFRSDEKIKQLLVVYIYV